jgi:hypothetical protein
MISAHPRLRQIEAGADALLKPADPPKWVLHSFEKACRRFTSKTAVVDGDSIPEGQRNVWLTSMAGKMRHAGFEVDAITAALVAENEARCSPPLREAEVRSIAKSVVQYAVGDESRRAPIDWPARLKETAFYGIAGELVRVLGPHSEADPAALLLQFLVAFGNVVGRRAHFLVEADPHFMNLFVILVGRTSKGRKGTSLSRIVRIFQMIDPFWSDKRVLSGLASGEGLIWAVRDPIVEHRAVRKNGRVAAYERVISDQGEDDKRLMVVEPEYARVLQVIEREKNTLSAIIRQAWDTGRLNTLTKNKAASATDAHISIIGHITVQELRRLLTDTAVGNGFANRFLFVCVERSKLLPLGGELKPEALDPVIVKVRAAVDFARKTKRMSLSKLARVLWCNVYAQLSDGKPGMLGSVTSRAEAQTLRLACIFALLDQSSLIKKVHLKAALEVWRYCDASARFVFSDAVGDSLSDTILRALRTQDNGMTRDELREHFSRNKTSSEIERALNVLQDHGLARMEKPDRPGRGRPIERWVAVSTIRTNGKM